MSEYQNKLENVQNIINMDEITREITASGTRIFSARDSLKRFKYIFSFGMLIGWTNILSVVWYGHDPLRACWQGLLLAISVFATFDLYTNIRIWLGIKSEEAYEKALNSRKLTLAPTQSQAQVINRVETVEEIT